MNFTDLLQALEVPEDQIDLFAALLARLCFAMDPGVDELELVEIFQEHFRTDFLIDVISVDILAQLARTTKYNPKYDTLH